MPLPEHPIARAWHQFTIALVVLAMVGMVATAILSMDLGPLVYVPVLATGLYLVMRSPGIDARVVCFRCGGRLHPVRSPERARLWTCGLCGWERPRRRTLAELARPAIVSQHP